ncbi:MAG: glycosyltransferase [Candidatus Eremiobacteraeota bacterium]|nr:glycosyltransferase [Candidatus Eremiobacteraeota bacterium]MCL5055487.1 glycosyltransferase [Bacillota bacterium]
MLNPFEVVFWDKSFHWREKIDELRKQSKSLILFLYKSPELNLLNFDSHIKMHQKFPFSIIQGNFSIHLQDRLLSPFRFFKEGECVQLPIPFSLSLSQEILDFLDLTECSTPLDFSFALKKVSICQQIPIYFVQDPEISYSMDAISCSSLLDAYQALKERFDKNFKRSKQGKIWGFNSSSDMRSFVRYFYRREFPRVLVSSDRTFPKVEVVFSLSSKLSEERFPFLKEYSLSLNESGIRVFYASAPSPDSNCYKILILYHENSFLMENLENILKNSSCHEIWVSTRFLRTKLLFLGCSVPIYVMPYAVDHSLFKPSIPSISDLIRRFVILGKLDSFSNDNLKVLIQAYRTVFRRSDSVLLLLCQEENKRFETIPFVNEDISKNSPYFARIFYSNLEAYASILNSCDLYIIGKKDLFSGYSSLQAMASGKPIAAPDIGESQEFLNKDNSWLFSSKDEDSSFKELMSAIYHAYSNPYELMKKGIQAYYDSLNWTYSRSSLFVVQRIRETMRVKQIQSFKWFFVELQ